MSADGEGMLLILNDVEPEHEDEFNLWYNTEHLQERVLVPGFIAASRYRSVSGVREYCALYRTSGVEVFESDVYRQRLSAQSDWSRRMLKAFVDPHRSVGRIGLSLGAGTGGYIGILKLPREADGSLDPAWRGAFVKRLADATDVIAVSLFESIPRLSGPVAEYRPSMRPIMTPEDRVLIVEASRPAVLAPENLAGIAGAALNTVTHLGVYAFAWQLARNDLP